MKVFFDYLPIICFFIVYKIYGIYAATAATIVITMILVGFSLIKNRKLEPVPLITLIMVVLLGGLTLILHDEIFIKWKPSIVYWIFTIALLGSQWFTKKNIMQRMMSTKIDMPTAIWERINYAWGVFFLLLGGINLYVVYHFSTTTWVNFKLFGTLVLILVFAILQAMYMAKYIKTDDPPEKP